VNGSVPSFANDLIAPQGDLKKQKHAEEVPVSVEADFVLGNQLDRGGGVESMVALRSWAMEFLGKLKAKMDRVICFGLGFRVKASRDLRRRMGWVFSRLGLKPKDQIGSKMRGKRKPRSQIKVGSGRGVSGPKGFWVKAGSGQRGGFNGVCPGIAGDQLAGRFFFDFSDARGRSEFASEFRCRFCHDGLIVIDEVCPNSSGGGRREYCPERTHADRAGDATDFVGVLGGGG
jgi:hypothetical protein